MKKYSTRMMIESSLMIAIATILSLIKIDLPLGGGITLVSALPLIIISYRYGYKWGLFTSFVFGCIQLLLGLDNVSYAENTITAIGIILFDYLIAFTVIGFSSIFGDSRIKMCMGIVFSFTLRFLCHLITGALIWGQWMPDTYMGMIMSNPWHYSFLYNSWYMLCETIFTLLVVMTGYKLFKNFFNK